MPFFILVCDIIKDEVRAQNCDSDEVLDCQSVKKLTRKGYDRNGGK